MKTMNILPGPVWLPHIVAAVLTIREKIRESREDSDLDYSRPVGRCASCGHKTYMLKGSLNEEVCSHCGLIRILVLRYK
jgi:hypothetical protein